MTHTEHYELSQWQKSDRLMMSDFNADNQKLDAALATLAAERYITSGTYAGDGTNGREIELGFNAAFAIIFCQTDEMIEQCFVTPGGTLYRSDQNGGMGAHPTVRVTGTKLRLWQNDPYCNYSGKSYFYIAFRT